MTRGRSAAVKAAMTAVMAVIICLCSWITVPFAVPFTMQTFAVFCAMLILGGGLGTASVALYLLLGAAGLPVFSGFTGGLGHMLGPTGGYMAGFLLTGLVYMAGERLIRRRPQLAAVLLAAGLLLCYLAGTLWFVHVMNGRGTAYGFGAALLTCVVPYIVPDAVKLALALLIAPRVKKQIHI